MTNSKTDLVMSLVEQLLDSEWRRLIRPLLLKRLRLYVEEAEAIQKEQFASRAPSEGGKGVDRE